MPKKFLDQNGLEYFAAKLNDYPTNEILGVVIDAIQDALDEKVDISTLNNADYQNSTQVNSAITTALGNITEFSISVLQSLPASGENGVFYFIPNAGTGNNIYDEYVYVNNLFEKIGSTEIDLSNYLQTTDIAAWAKAATKPTYTAAEVGALPSTTVIPAAYDDTALAARVTALENIPWVTYYTGTSEPSNSQGQNGDIYLQTES